MQTVADDLPVNVPDPQSSSCKAGFPVVKRRHAVKDMGLAGDTVGDGHKGCIKISPAMAYSNPDTRGSTVPGEPEVLILLRSKAEIPDRIAGCFLKLTEFFDGADAS